MAEFIAVVYGTESKNVRRVYVSDLQRDIKAVLRSVDGESVLFIEGKLLPLMNSARGFHSYVGSIIGTPTYGTRAVELDATGTVVAAYSADPKLDTPILNKDNTMELHRFALVGDKKNERGRFPDPYVRHAQILIDHDTPLKGVIINAIKEEIELIDLADRLKFADHYLTLQELTNIINTPDEP